MLTFKIEFPRDFLQFRDTTEMRRQVLNVSSIESLTGLDEIQVMLFELPFFYRLFLLPILFAQLLNTDEQSLETLPSNQNVPPFPSNEDRETHAGE